MIESHIAIIDNLQRLIDEAEKIIVAMDAAAFEVARVDEGTREIDFSSENDDLNIAEVD